MKGLGKRILMMAAVTAVCVWAAGKSGYAVKPIRLDETELAQQVQALKENNLMVFDTVVPISARLIANKAAYQFINKKINEVVEAMTKQVKETL